MSRNRNFDVPGVIDPSVQPQINHMIAFIDQESMEKVEEIRVKAEEEYSIEKGNLIQTERLKIMEYYQRRMDSIELQKKFQLSTIMSKSRLAILKHRAELLEEMENEIIQQMTDDISSEAAYKPILSKIMLQALLKALEPDVLLRCMKNDEELVNSLLPSVIAKYQEITGTGINITVDRRHYLQKNAIGGIEAIATCGHIKVVNTLQSRLKSVLEELQPEIRSALFGRNPHRKFNE